MVGLASGALGARSSRANAPQPMARGHQSLYDYGLAAWLLGCLAARWHHQGMGTKHRFHGYVSLQRRGVVALPAEVRVRMHLDEPGAQLEVTEREDGVLELRAALPVPADQAWFWTQRWQEREREVDELLAAGQVTVHDDVDDFLAHVDDIAGADKEPAGE